MKCVVLGDSITEGIGSKKINYILPLQRIAGEQYSFMNLAKTGTTIQYACSIKHEILGQNPDCILMMYGSVDAQIRADLSKDRFGICKLIPKRYKIGGMLEPRAVYSKKWYRVIPERIDNFLRKILKNMVLISQGTTQWVDLDTFRILYEDFLSGFDSSCQKFLISTVYIDDRYFLNSSLEYEKYNAVIQDLCRAHQCTYIDIFSELKQSVLDSGWDKYYLKDHFHPNSDGYEMIAEVIGTYILGEQDRRG